MKNKKTHMKRMLMLSLLTGACCFHSYATANEPVLMKGAYTSGTVKRKPHSVTEKRNRS
jgi:hypothetical protein